MKNGTEGSDCSFPAEVALIKGRSMPLGYMQLELLKVQGTRSPHTVLEIVSKLYSSSAVSNICFKKLLAFKTKSE